MNQKIYYKENRKCLIIFFFGLFQVLPISDVWERYIQLAAEAGIEVPNSFVTRRATFKDKLQSALSDIYQFIQPLNRDKSERETLLIPLNCPLTASTHLSQEDVHVDQELNSPNYKPTNNDSILPLVHAALLIRRELIASPGHMGLNVSEAEITKVIPEKLNVFLHVLFSGQDGICDEADGCNTTIEEDDDEDPSLEVELCDIVGQKNNRMMSIAQDIVYSISGGKKWTPKHVGLALTLHQKTRSRKLVGLFNSAGHCISYRQLMTVDTALAETTLKSLDRSTGAVIPPNLIPSDPEKTGEVTDRLVHVTADNIDILNDTLDGKNTFHATQMVAFQRGGATTDDILKEMKPSRVRSLSAPSELGSIILPSGFKEKQEPVFRKEFDKDEVFHFGEKRKCVVESEALDLSFIFTRQDADDKTSWSTFNELLSSNDQVLTAVGYLPMILNPAHELGTLNTVLQRCLSIADHLNHQHIVLTVDQALYCKLLELKWSNQDYQRRIVLKMGGLHIAMNFLGVIGKHMGGCGLEELWIESGLMGEGAVQLVLQGKRYAKAMRAHKLTYQALWQILMPMFRDWLRSKHPLLLDEIDKEIDDPLKLAEVLASDIFQGQLDNFMKSRSNDDVNFAFWIGYMNMISILLRFTRALRDGKWELYCESVCDMLPYLRRYDHLNYAKSVTAYLIEMSQLPEEIRRQFYEGDFVVKRSSGKFNQVDADHAQEWLVGTGKDSGGIVGITNQPSALQRWSLSFNWRSDIAQKTFKMFGISSDIDGRNESKPGRRKRDMADELAVKETLIRFTVFVNSSSATTLVNIATKDVATDSIQESLLNAQSLGMSQIDNFIDERLTMTVQKTTKVKYNAPMKKNQPETFTTLYKQVKVVDEKKKVAKMDRHVMQRLIAGYESGRSVDLSNILKHELVTVPLSLTDMDGSLRTGNKAVLMNLMTKDIQESQELQVDRESTQLIIDGQAMIVSLGKPADAHTFGDLADNVLKYLTFHSHTYHRIDVTFDRYLTGSVKNATRKRRTGKCRPIRRVIEGRHVPLPKNWNNFLALSENKSNLSRFLSQEIIRQGISHTEVVVAGGFENETEVQSTNPLTDVTLLKVAHEEADTRIVLHAVHSSCNTVVVSVRDTDVFLMLVYHLDKMQCNKLWMMAGTSKARRFIPIHEVHRMVSSEVLDSLLAFHAISGCDTTSYIRGHTKQTMWNTFCENPTMLEHLGKGPLTEEAIKSAEQFFCKVYKTNVNSIDEARRRLFTKTIQPECLPPTSDALQQHIKRAHYQATVWEQACSQGMQDPADPTMHGWQEDPSDPSNLTPVLTTIDTVPKECLDIVTCKCKKDMCKSDKCKCRKSNIQCCIECDCHNHGTCKNIN